METGLSGSNEEEDEDMSVLAEFLNLLADTVEKQCDLEYEISLEELKADGGIYAELGEGFTTTEYYDKSTLKTISVLFMCRDKNQQTCMEQLCKICDYLQRLKEYPSGKTFSWKDTAIAKEPNKIGRDEGGMYHYSCILNCQIFY